MEMVKNLRFEDFVPTIEMSDKLFVERVVQGFDNIIRTEIKFKPAPETFSLAADKDKEALKAAQNSLSKGKNLEEENSRLKGMNDTGERSRSAKTSSIRLTAASRKIAANESRKSAASQDPTIKEDSLRANSGKIYEEPENLSLTKLPSIMSQMDKEGAGDNRSIVQEGNSRSASVRGSTRSVKVKSTGETQAAGKISAKVGILSD